MTEELTSGGNQVSTGRERMEGSNEEVGGVGTASEMEGSDEEVGGVGDASENLGQNGEECAENGGFFESTRLFFKDLFYGCGIVCWTICPPVPEKIISKIAFHPPDRLTSYRIVLEEDPAKWLSDASETAGRPFRIEPVQRKGCQQAGYDQIAASCCAFSIRTLRGNDIVCVRFRTPRLPLFEAADAFEKQVILFAQPNGMDISDFMQPNMVNFLSLAEQFQVDVYAFDYSGYGYSSGTPSERNIYADIEAVYEHIRLTQPFKKIVLMGYSIGTSAVMELASQNRPGISGVVLIAPLTSGLRHLAGRPYRAQAYCCDRFTNKEKASEIRVPALFIHGTEDNVIYIEHSHELLKLLPRPVPPLFVYGADHLTIFSAFLPWERIRHFLRQETELGDSMTSLPVKTAPTPLPTLPSSASLPASTLATLSPL